MARFEFQYSRSSAGINLTTAATIVGHGLTPLAAACDAIGGIIDALAASDLQPEQALAARLADLIDHAREPHREPLPDVGVRRNPAFKREFDEYASDYADTRPLSTDE